MLKFIHAADLHLDSPLRGLERYDGAPVEQLRGATRRALKNLVELAINEKVDFVLIAGDVYDGKWIEFNTGLFFNAQMSRLREAGIRVFLISGNHDAENVMTQRLRLPENVLRLEHREPETVALDDLGVAIHGQSFATRAVMDRLAANYPEARPGYFNIGLLHTSATGYQEHDPYAPCSMDELRTKGYDYWALGHIHKREELLAQPRVAFCGNLQGRNIRETGPKGCSVVEVDNRGQLTIRFEPLDVLRWECLRISASEAQHPDDVLTLFADALKSQQVEAGDRLLALRVELHGRSAAHDSLASSMPQWSAEIRAAANDIAPDQAWIEKIKLKTERPLDAVLPSEGPLGELMTYLQEIQSNEVELSALAAELKDLDSKLPGELKVDRDSGEPLNVLDRSWLRDTLTHVQPLLLDRLQIGGWE